MKKINNKISRSILKVIIEFIGFCLILIDCIILRIAYLAYKSLIIFKIPIYALFLAIILINGIYGFYLKEFLKKGKSNNKKTYNNLHYKLFGILTILSVVIGMYPSITVLLFILTAILFLK